jgi:hypothetical protein
MKNPMKLNDIIQKPTRRQVMILTEHQLQTLASRVIQLMEHGQIIRTYLIKKKSNGKEYK